MYVNDDNMIETTDMNYITYIALAIFVIKKYLLNILDLKWWLH